MKEKMHPVPHPVRKVNEKPAVVVKTCPVPHPVRKVNEKPAVVVKMEPGTSSTKVCERLRFRKVLTRPIACFDPLIHLG